MATPSPFTNLVPEEIERLRRKPWQSARELADELYAMFTSTIAQDSAADLANSGDGSGTSPPPPPGVSPPPPPPPPGPGPAPGSGTGGSGLDPGTVSWPAPAPASAIPTAMPFCAWAIVRGQIAYNLYLCDLYLKDPSGAPSIGQYIVEQRQIDSAESIPNGTETLALVFAEKIGSQTVPNVALMQVPVWLDFP